MNTVKIINLFGHCDVFFLLLFGTNMMGMNSSWKIFEKGNVRFLCNIRKLMKYVMESNRYHLLGKYRNFQGLRSSKRVSFNKQVFLLTKFCLQEKFLQLPTTTPMKSLTDKILTRHVQLPISNHTNISWHVTFCSNQNNSLPLFFSLSFSCMNLMYE